MGKPEKTRAFFGVVDEGARLFEAGKWFGSGWGLRSTLFPADGKGGLAVYAPVARLGRAIHEQIAARGPVRWLVAPNHFHHLGLPEWLERYPGARVVSSPAAATRIQKKSGLQPEPPEAFTAHLPPGVALLLPDGLKNGEGWVTVETKAGPALLVCDAFFNVPGPLRGVVGAILKALRAGPGLNVSRTWAWLHCREQGVYAGWLARTMQDAAPALLVPCHGDIIRDPGLGERLTALAGQGD